MQVSLEHVLAAWCVPGHCGGVLQGSHIVGFHRAVIQVSVKAKKQRKEENRQGPLCAYGHLRNKQVSLGSWVVYLQTLLCEGEGIAAK